MESFCVFWVWTVEIPRKGRNRRIGEVLEEGVYAEDGVGLKKRTRSQRDAFSGIGSVKIRKDLQHKSHTD
jgi:hypothetical protein